MKAFTDIEQSKKLADILPIESADMMWDDWSLIDEGWKLIVGYYPEIEKDYGRKCYPAWSLAALLDILPSEFKYYETTYEIDIRKYALTDDVDLYQIAYRNCKIDEDGHLSWKDMINTGEKEDLVDCCYEMIVKLKEKDLL